MADFKKLNEAIELMHAIKSTFEDNPKQVNKETRKQRYEQAKTVIQYQSETKYALLVEQKKREKQALSYEEQISLWRLRAEARGYKEGVQKLDARVAFNEQFDTLTF